MNASERRQIVRRMLRAHDPDRYLATLFAPRAARDDLFALYAFNAELARIPDEVSEPALGEIRLQWWRDALLVASAGEGEGEATGNPVADAMGLALAGRGIPPSRLDPLIDARRFDMLDKIMPDDASLIRYLDQTAGTLFGLAGEMLGGERAQLEPAAKSAGRAYGLTGLMRAVAHHAARERLFLPVVKADGTPLKSPAALLNSAPDPAFLGLLAEMRRQARAELARARGAVGALPEKTRIAFQPLALVEPYLKSLEALGDPLAGSAAINPLYRLWRLAVWRP